MPASGSQRAGLARTRLDGVPQIVELLKHKDQAIATGAALAAKRYGEKILGAITHATAEGWEDEVAAKAITDIASELTEDQRRGLFDVLPLRQNNLAFVC